jgi:hypothetical protein
MIAVSNNPLNRRSGKEDDRMMRFGCACRLSRCFVCLLAAIGGLVLLAFIPAALAKTHWQVYQNLKLQHTPVDFQVSEDGRWLYVLSEEGNLLIYSAAGKLKDTISVGPNVDRIKTGPREGVLFLLNSKERTLQVVGVSISEQIDIKGSPVKGLSSAPVTIAVFSDFQ